MRVVSSGRFPLRRRLARVLQRLDSPDDAGRTDSDRTGGVHGREARGLHGGGPV